MFDSRLTPGNEEAQKPTAPRNRAERRKRQARRRVDYAASATLAAEVETKGFSAGGALAEAARCHHRREAARKAKRRAARAAHRRNR